MLTSEEQKEIERELTLYERKSGACIDALKIVQRHRGWISDEALNDIAQFLAMSPEELENVATFYNLIYRKPVGENVILLCNSVSCWICGYESIRNKLSSALNIGFGETTQDGKFTLLPIQCLGTCDHAPAMMINDELYRDLDGKRIGEIIEHCRKSGTK